MTGCVAGVDMLAVLPIVLCCDLAVEVRGGTDGTAGPVVTEAGRTSQRARPRPIGIFFGADIRERRAKIPRAACRLWSALSAIDDFERFLWAMGGFFFFLL
jgi:hypothetical protein